MPETLIATPEFEPRHNREIEQKFLPLYPELLDSYRDAASPIEQLYLSHPDESFNIRLRETIELGGAVRYEATLKDRGELTPQGIDRLEVTTDISPRTYSYYKHETSVASIKKLRANANNNVMIDYFDDNDIHIESEDPIAWTHFLDQSRTPAEYYDDISGQMNADNEWRAYRQYRIEHNGESPFVVETETKPDLLATEIRDLTRCSQDPTIIQIVGRSGSGKSTYVRQLQTALCAMGLGSEVLSTDDYHRGGAWLTEHNDGKPWQNWDLPIVYDLSRFVFDLETLRSGSTITRRTIDFSIVEPVEHGFVAPTPVIIVEGIFARTPEIARLSSMYYEMKTPLATSIGRRLIRDATERPQFADLEKGLRYMLETAEIEYQSQTL